MSNGPSAQHSPASASGFSASDSLGSARHRARRSKTLGSSLLLVATLLGSGHVHSATQPPTVQRSAASQQFASLVDDFVSQLGKHYPTEATDLGLHQFDHELEDLSPSGVQKTLSWLATWDARLAALDKSKLLDEERFDLQLLRHSLLTRRFVLTELPEHRRRPLAYSALASECVNQLLKRNFAPLEVRMKAAISRLRRASALIDLAPKNLDQLSVASVEVTLRTLPATIAFFRSDVVKAFSEIRDPALQAQLHEASSAIVSSLERFGDFLRKDGKAKASPQFALGPALFQRALFAEEMIETPTSELLQQAEAELQRLRSEFQKTAALIDPTRSAHETQTLVSQDHPKTAELIDYTASRLAQQRKFLIDKQIVTVPSDVLPLVRETPPFMRATTLASMDTPGPYEKTSEAYYYITLPEPSWPPGEAEDFLRGAHNRPLIDVVAIHEAFPGHYIQYLWLGKLSKVKQVAQVRSNSEGWAHYTEEMMMQQGYSSDPKVRLMQLQDALLRAARFVAGIRMHCHGMTQAQAEEFFVKEGLQMKTVAELEARRGTQDPLYVVYTYGKLQIMKLRQDYKAQQGSAYSLKSFHDTLLGFGRAPLGLIRQVMLKK
ncbi:MAG: DUF885 domain-containing protein [Myxococcales bacterium]|nr:DUF885 domain-containing protein [Myxococcales bacterium]